MKLEIPGVPGYSRDGYIFERRSGRGAKVTICDTAKPLFEALRFWVESLESRYRHQFKIHLSASLTMGTHWVPGPTREWRDAWLRSSSGAAPPPIRMSHGKPDEFHSRARAGELDVVLSSFPIDLSLNHLIDDAERDWAEVVLPMYLILPNGHELAYKPFDWDRLRDHTFVLLDPKKRTVPPYPLNEIDRVGQPMEVESYEEAFAQVLAGGRVATFACPQVLNDHLRAQVEAVELPAEPRYQSMKIRICLLRPRAARAWRTATENRQIDDLFDRMKASLQLLDPQYRDEGLVRAGGPRDIWFVSRDAAGTCWRRSEAKLRFLEDGFVKGEHAVDLPARHPDGRDRFRLNLTLEGRARRHIHRGRDQDTRVYHLALRATAPSHSDGEDYVASLVCDTDIRRGRFVGVWSGLDSEKRVKDRLTATSGGYMVILEQTAVAPTERLNDWVLDYQDKYGKMDLDLPDRAR